MPIKIIRKAKRPPEPPKPPTPAPAAEKTRHGHYLDGTCKTVISMHPNAAVSWYLIASYAYYVLDVALISDAMYDELAKRILTRWKDAQAHPHAQLLDEEALKAGTAYHLRAVDYPTMVKGAARHLAQSEWGVTLPML